MFIYFIQCVYANLKLLIYPSLPFLFDNLMFVFCVCESPSVL